MRGDLFDREGLKYCYKCGKCSSGCEVARLDPSFRPHRILHLIGMGAIDRLLQDDSLWKCTTCFACSERCPQGIGVTEIIWFARTMAAGSGRPVPPLLAAQKDILRRTGRLIPADNKKRQKAGLEPVQEESPVVARILELTEGKE